MAVVCIYCWSEKLVRKFFPGPPCAKEYLATTIIWYMQYIIQSSNLYLYLLLYPKPTKETQVDAIHAPRCLVSWWTGPDVDTGVSEATTSHQMVKKGI